MKMRTKAILLVLFVLLLALVGCDTKDVYLDKNSIAEYSIVTENEAYRTRYTETVKAITGTEPAEATKELVLQNTLTETKVTVTKDGEKIVLDCGGDYTPEVALRYLGHLLTTTDGLCADTAYALTPEVVAGTDPLTVWVSPDGKDDNDGSEGSPLATLEGAKNKVKTLALTYAGPITVNFRKGEYMMTETVHFHADDSGFEGAPVTYKAYNGEDVAFLGGVHVPRELITPADAAIADRVIDKTAASKLLQMDLSSLLEGVEIPDFYKAGSMSAENKSPFEVYVSGEALTHSRWPNKGIENEYLIVTNENLIGTATGTTEDNGVTYSTGHVDLTYTDALAERMKLWDDAAYENLHLYGYLIVDYAAEIYDASDVNLETNTIRIPGGTDARTYSWIVDNISSGYDKRYYIFNLIEEIDVPGESYIDRENKIFYFLPEDGANLDEVFVSTLLDSIVNFYGASHIVLDGFEFSYTRATPITGSSTSDIDILNSTIAHTSDMAINLSGNRFTVDYCHIYDTAYGGIRMVGGDRQNLISGESVISNCDIHHFTRGGSSYNPAVSAESVGLIIRNNEIHDTIHQAIGIDTNDVIVEYNEIYNCVTEFTDAGAIYFGRDITRMGNVFRYNYFHDIGNPYGGASQSSIYMDDCSIGSEIYGNIFDGAAEDFYAIASNNAQFTHVYNNVFMNMKNGCYMHNDWDKWRDMTKDDPTGWQYQWYLWVYDQAGKGYTVQDNLIDKNFYSETWQKHYEGTIWGQIYDYVTQERAEQYKDYTEEQLLEEAKLYAPYNVNKFYGNVAFTRNLGYLKNQFGQRTGAFDEYDNLKTNKIDICWDAEKLQLTEEGLERIREKYPEFEQIPADKIGIGGND